MKKLNSSIIIIISALLVVFTGCKKYDEGPGISLRSKTERVANTWKIEYTATNGVDYTSYFTDYTMTFTKGGEYSFTWGSLTGSGKWEFQNDKNDIKISGVSNQSSETIHILKLKEKEFWYYSMDGNDRTDVHLVPVD
jgi:hypothetical protein